MEDELQELEGVEIGLLKMGKYVIELEESGELEVIFEFLD